ncbi:hypothetical protein SAMN05444267_101970 [Chryseobacterium polytrichastri]|uniref:Uncharacterized protein n=2 Tax=Chryseobacterium polytrichastri TaxID=1302687 RepID=A0A1M7BF38_9FLAO|nr:hypothetical protein SAMN05444267_101970 [Chryseobacterium polytrichastri]
MSHCNTFAKTGRNTKKKKTMKIGEKQINTKNQKTAVSPDKAASSVKKTKPGISSSFFQRIISLLKKEELI